MSANNQEEKQGFKKPKLFVRILLGIFSSSFYTIFFCIALGVLTIFVYSGGIANIKLQELIVSVIWGGCLGVLIVVEISSLSLQHKASLRTISGGATGMFTAIFLGWDFSNALISLIIGALLARYFPVWGKHLNFP